MVCKANRVHSVSDRVADGVHVCHTCALSQMWYVPPCRNMMLPGNCGSPAVCHGPSKHSACACRGDPYCMVQETLQHPGAASFGSTRGCDQALSLIGMPSAAQCGTSMSILQALFWFSRRDLGALPTGMVAWWLPRLLGHSDCGSRSPEQPVL